MYKPVFLRLRRRLFFVDAMYQFKFPVANACIQIFAFVGINAPSRNSRLRIYLILLQELLILLSLHSRSPLKFYGQNFGLPKLIPAVHQYGSSVPRDSLLRGGYTNIFSVLWLSCIFLLLWLLFCLSQFYYLYIFTNVLVSCFILWQ